MKLDLALVACNNNPKYLDFWNLVHYAWTQIGVKVKLVFVGEKIPDDLPFPEDVILFPPLTGAEGPEATGWTAQVVRLFYPALLHEFTQDAVIISDMDMVPMNANYFHASIAELPNDTFFCYRDVIRHEEMLPICYNAALPHVWQKVFHAKTVDEVRSTMQALHAKWGSNWNTDQFELLTRVLRAQTEGLSFVARQDGDYPQFSRLDRIDKEVINMQVLTSGGGFCDFHMLRPAKEFAVQNQKLFDTFFQSAMPKSESVVVTSESSADAELPLESNGPGSSPSDTKEVVLTTDTLSSDCLLLLGILLGFSFLLLLISAWYVARTKNGPPRNFLGVLIKNKNHL